MLDGQTRPVPPQVQWAFAGFFAVLSVASPLRGRPEDVLASAPMAVFSVLMARADRGRRRRRRRPPDVDEVFE